MQLQHMSAIAFRFVLGFGNGSTCADIYCRNEEEGHNHEHAVQVSDESRHDNMKLTMSSFSDGSVCVTVIGGHANILYFVTYSGCLSSR
jgi:hypothetical protein